MSYIGAAAAVLLAGCSTDSSDGDRAAGQASPGTSAASMQTTCERACLEGFIDRYLDALVARDPAQLPLAPNVKFVENNQVLEIGDGTWRTVTGLGTYRHYFADVAAGQAGMIGIVEENGTKIIYDLRLAIDDSRITEIEAMIARDSNAALLYEQHGEPHPKFLETVPPDERLPRAELIAIADKYFSGMERNDPNGDYSFFHDECDRWEHARRTTNNDPEEYGHSTDTVFVTLNCREQFETGFLGFVTRIRDRRYVVIDEERQTVLAFALFDHNGTIREIPLSNGTTFVVPPYFSSPRTLQVGEAWRIQDGKLRQIEMTLTEFPYGMPPAFESGDDWLARDAAQRELIAAAPALPAPCDRACLNGFVDKFLAALIARDPALLPAAAGLKYTENGQRLNPGDGLWGTATELGDYALYAADPTSGTVAFYGTIVETDVPGLLTVRLEVADQRVTEIEAAVFRQETVDERGGTLTLFAPRELNPFDPAGFARADLALMAAAASSSSLAELDRIAAGYYDALLASDGARASLADACRRRENGVITTGVADAPAPDAGHPDFRPASLGCAEQLSSKYFSYLQRLAERRTLAADADAGLVVDLALLDVPNDERLVDVPGVGSVTLPMPSTGPYSVILAQVYKIQNGEIEFIEAVSRPVPYGMSSGWQ
jgi:hypothetical protein